MTAYFSSWGREITDFDGDGQFWGGAFLGDARPQLADPTSSTEGKYVYCDVTANGWWELQTGIFGAAVDSGGVEEMHFYRSDGRVYWSRQIDSDDDRGSEQVGYCRGARSDVPSAYVVMQDGKTIQHVDASGDRLWKHKFDDENWGVAADVDPTAQGQLYIVGSDDESADVFLAKLSPLVGR